ncbi:hypothetical protein GGH96_006044 [Coemansia sp. RSA 1972]|nr:hypothetical protein GGH96_006044 [Coemansia sp. RSA 1972]
MTLFAFILAYTCIHTVLALNITCAAFDVLPKLTYNNVAPQGQASMVIAFAPSTSQQLMDAFRDALICRGSTVDEPNYNTRTLTGYMSLAFKSGLETSKYVEAVDVDGLATVMAVVHPTNTPLSAPARESSSSSEQSQADDGLDSESDSSRACWAVPRAQPILSNDRHTAKYRKVESQKDTTQKLLSESPNYKSGCDLYPKAMRDVINETRNGAVDEKRDPCVTRQAEQTHLHALQEQQMLAATDPDKLFCFYPGASRHAPK